MVSRIVDATAFYSGIPFSSTEKNFTTPAIFEEIKHIKKNHDAIRVLVDTNRLEVIEPEAEYVKKVSLVAKETGDRTNLSNGDLSVLALSLQLGLELVTDDFAISNTAKHLKIKVNPVMTKGISYTATWQYYCSGCDMSFAETLECPRCGNKLKRRLVKRKSAVNTVRK